MLLTIRYRQQVNQLRRKEALFKTHVYVFLVIILAGTESALEFARLCVNMQRMHVKICVYSGTDYTFPILFAF
jgi:hypothetical protein